MQQRAREYIILSKGDNGYNELPNMSEIRNNIVGKIPQYFASFFNNIILIKNCRKVYPKI